MLISAGREAVRSILSAPQGRANSGPDEADVRPNAIPVAGCAPAGIDSGLTL